MPWVRMSSGSSGINTIYSKMPPPKVRAAGMSYRQIPLRGVTFDEEKESNPRFYRLRRKNLRCLPAVAAQLRALAVPAACAAVLADVVSVLRAATACDVRHLAAFLTHTWSSF